jgi:hypothetical protein
MVVTFESVLEHVAVAVLMMVVLRLTSHDIETADLAVRRVGNGVVFVVAVVVDDGASVVLMGGTFESAIVHAAAADVVVLMTMTFAAEVAESPIPLVVADAVVVAAVVAVAVAVAVAVVAVAVAVVVVVLSVAVTCACSNPDVAVGAFALKVTIFETAGLNVVAVVVVVQVVAVVVVPDVHSNLQGGCLVKWKTLCLHHKPLFRLTARPMKFRVLINKILLIFLPFFLGSGWNSLNYLQTSIQ